MNMWEKGRVLTLSCNVSCTVQEKSMNMWEKGRVLTLSCNVLYTEFWIYSVYGKFYLKLVRGASPPVRPENPSILS